MSMLKPSLVLAGVLALAGTAGGVFAQNVSIGEVDQTTGQPEPQAQGGTLNHNELADAPSGTNSATRGHIIDRTDVIRQPDGGTTVESARVIEPVQSGGVHTKNMRGVNPVHNAMGDVVAPGPATVDNASAGLEDNARMAQ